MPGELIIFLSFTICFFAGEIVAFVVFKFIRKALYKNEKHAIASILKGMFERFVLLLGIISTVTSVFALYGAVKIATRLKEEQDSKISNDYFLVGNLTSATIAILDSLIYPFIVKLF